MYSTPVVSFNPIFTALPPNIGKLATSLAKRATEIRFFPACAEARGPPELQELSLDRHQSAEMMNHERQHGLPISLPREISEEEFRAALHYLAHSFAMKEVDFVHQELADQAQAGHIVVLPLTTV